MNRTIKYHREKSVHLCQGLQLDNVPPVENLILQGWSRVESPTKEDVDLLRMDVP